MNLSQTIEAARNVLRFKHMAYKTEKSYIGWIRRYAYWCRDNASGSHEEKVRAFLTYLARERTVSASTQNQSLNAIVFLYRHVLQEDVGDFSGFHPARQPRRLPVVLSRDEVSGLLSHLTGIHWLIAALLYGSGLLLAMGWRSEVIERQLAHAERDKVKAAYNHAEYMPERREMMQAWADWVDGLKTEATPARP